MDHSCQDIPMRLDINHQPLNFDIYLAQVIDIPKTSLDEPPYDFHLEHEALEKVDQMIERTLKETKCADNVSVSQQSNLQMYMDQSPLQPTTIATVTQPQEQCNSHAMLSTTASSNTNSASGTISPTPANIPPPSCPIAETPLTPVKCTFQPALKETNTSAFSTNGTTNVGAGANSTGNGSNQSTVNQINPREFEEMHYNPFDHLELQTIDELKELDLVFQASYANQASKQ